ncbi:MAG TPA: phosphotransferase [Methylophilaceae bacterium]|nr:phosphotransferase [Methylophilaceae bacterium]
MSLAQLWPQVAALRNSCPDGVPMVWKVLYAYRRQPLLVPIDPAQARTSVKFFMRNPALRAWGQLMLTLDCWFPQAHLLTTVRLESFPCTTLFGSCDPYASSLFGGSSGPLQKLTMYCPGKNGGEGKVAKVALQKSANIAIEREAWWLEQLSDIPQIAGFLPQLLRHGALPCGRRYLSMTALPMGKSGSHMDEAHLEFLSILAQQRPPLTSWRRSGAFTRLYRRTHEVLPMIDPYYRRLLLEAMSEVEQQIGQRQLPSCIVHNDFAPWNLRVAEGRLFVFDWEYAEASGNPLHDFLHFHLITRALKRLPLSIKELPKISELAADYARAVFGPESGVAEATSSLMTHYLLDILTFYIEASNHLDLKHPVLSTYLRLLECRAEWQSESLNLTVIPGHVEQQRAI